MEKKDVRGYRFTVRLPIELADKIKKQAKADGVKPSEIVRRALYGAQNGGHLARAVEDAKKQTEKTRQDLSRVTGNIHQISKMYSSRSVSDIPQLVAWDKENRAALLPLLVELRQQNYALIELCNQVLGRK